jgi:hypothetical protein
MILLFVIKLNDLKVYSMFVIFSPVLVLFGLMCCMGLCGVCTLCLFGVPVPPSDGTEGGGEGAPLPTPGDAPTPGHAGDKVGDNQV